MFNDYSKRASEAKYKIKYVWGLQILTSKQMLQRLPVTVAQVKAGNIWKSNHIFLVSEQKKLLKKVNNNIMN